MRSLVRYVHALSKRVDKRDNALVPKFELSDSVSK